jgi:hypothetical protein
VVFQPLGKGQVLGELLTVNGFLFLFLFSWHWVFNSWSQDCQAGTLAFAPCLQTQNGSFLGEVRDSLRDHLKKKKIDGGS